MLQTVGNHCAKTKWFLYIVQLRLLTTWSFFLWFLSDCGDDINLNKTISIKSPKHPNFAPLGIKCSWRIRSIDRKSVVVQGINLDFGSEIKDDCNNGMLEIFNGCDKDRFLVEKICVRRSDVQKGILWVSSVSCVTVTFSSGQRKDNKFHLSVAESIGKDIYMKNFLHVCFLDFGLHNIWLFNLLVLFIVPGYFVP